MSEIDRLNNYHDFSVETTEAVAEVAERYRSYETWPELFSDFQSAASHAQLHEVEYTPARGFPIKIVDIVPTEIDTSLVYHLPMGNSIDQNMQARLLTLSAVLPNTRIIAAGNPAQPLTNSGRLTQQERNEVSRGRFRPTVDPILAYAHKEKIEQADQVGFSYGADKALAATLLTDYYDISTPKVVPMDPASVTPRTILQLGADFLATNKHLNDYVEATEFPAYIDARKVTGRKTGWLAGYGLGLTRQSNIAIARGITVGKFETRLAETLRHNPETHATLVWGTESELAINGIMHALAGRISDSGQANQFTAMPVIGQYHAMGDDIFLHAALVHESLTKRHA